MLCIFDRLCYGYISVKKEYEKNLGTKKREKKCQFKINCCPLLGTQCERVTRKLISFCSVLWSRQSQMRMGTFFLFQWNSSLRCLSFCMQKWGNTIYPTVFLFGHIFFLGVFVACKIHLIYNAQHDQSCLGTNISNIIIYHDYMYGLI